MITTARPSNGPADSRRACNSALQEAAIQAAKDKPGPESQFSPGIFNQPIRLTIDG